MNRPTDFGKSRARSRQHLVLVLLAVVPFAAACQSDEMMCPAWNRSPLIVEVRDASTGAPAAVGATGEIRSGSFVSPLLLPGATEDLELYSSGPAATYDVIVQKEGYRDWTRNGVYVQGDNCGVVRPAVLRAHLERTS